MVKRVVIASGSVVLALLLFAAAAAGGRRRSQLEEAGIRMLSASASPNPVLPCLQEETLPPELLAMSVAQDGSMRAALLDGLLMLEQFSGCRVQAPPRSYLLRAAAARLLGVAKAEPEKRLGILIALLSDPADLVREQAALALCSFPSHRHAAVDALKAALGDPVASVRIQAGRSVQKLEQD